MIDDQNVVLYDEKIDPSEESFYDENFRMDLEDVPEVYSQDVPPEINGLIALRMLVSVFVSFFTFYLCITKSARWYLFIFAFLGTIGVFIHSHFTKRTIEDGDYFKIDGTVISSEKMRKHRRGRYYQIKMQDLDGSIISFRNGDPIALGAKISIYIKDENNIANNNGEYVVYDMISIKFLS